MARGDFVQADESFERAERDYPGARRHVLTARGDACFEAGRMKEALSAYLRADVPASEAPPKFCYRIASLLVSVERPDYRRALSYVRQAAGVERDNPTYLKLFGEIELALEESGAEETLLKALHATARGPVQRGHNVAILILLARIALSERRNRDTEHYLAEAEKLDTGNDKIAELRARVRDPEVMRSIAAELKEKRRPRRR